CGALSTPYAFDWDSDGDEDILCGNTAGYIEFFENLSGVGSETQWAAPVRLLAGGKPIRIQAGPNGSIQGPCEAKWGYTTISVGDWDHDGRHDIVANSIWGKVVWFRNVGSNTKPELTPAQPVSLGNSNRRSEKPKWNWWNPSPGELVTQWRTTPYVVDWNEDGLNDLVMLDHEGYLALYRRFEDNDGVLSLSTPQRIFVDESMNPLRLNDRLAGGSGRRKLAVADWDGDGRKDILINSVNADWYRNDGERDGKTVLQHQGAIARRELSSHTTSPAVCDLNRDGKPDLLLGAEDGHLYYLPSARTQ
ncbi:MAG: VCBS repeat-containing protein, partial [Planctomycetales bacterium]|nr:VCBS repeat-containing protein [Planctomycetales bacterium]